MQWIYDRNHGNNYAQFLGILRSTHLVAWITRTAHLSLLNLDTNLYIHSDVIFVPVSLYELVGKSILVIPSLAEERFVRHLERLDRDVLT